MKRPNSDPYVFTARALDPIAQYAATYGLDYLRLSASVGLGGPRDTDPDAVVPASAMSALLEAIAREVGDDMLGLRLGVAAPIGAAGTLDYVVLNAPTLRDALKNLVRFVRIGSTVPAVRYEENAESGELLWTTPAVIGPCTHLVDMAVGFTISRVRHAIGDPSIVLQLDRERLPPRDTAAYITSTKGRVQFSRPVDRLSIPARVLAVALPKADANLYRIIAREAERALEAHAHTNDITHRLSTFIAQRLSEGEPTIADAAADFAVSARTLQRELQAAGTTFSQVLESVRRTMAERYLKDTGLSLTEIAFLLGFSELSAFSRAASAWFGTPPRLYRRKSTG